ncbi:hypothetical protein H0484_11080 [Pusillimonas sp. CC-YST705]|uniref:Uncharacterized protein n=1 Tax=Mesopusillimonas faecipullorum TaxID=2755040 RepID=A0ABS8CE21_9BURK|nr:hypothetical protein [Mesopusillimonas faecipullorum]MCB5364291.1 hypothetical protein [Mesopusillimonas faecipullorum]
MLVGSNSKDSEEKTLYTGRGYFRPVFSCLAFTCAFGALDVKREQEDAHVARNAGISRGQFLLNLLTVLMAVWALYQGWATSQWQQEVTERLEKQRQTDQQVLYQLDQQRQLNDRMLKQLESLTEKVEKALLQEEKRERQRFVVRDRVATVRRSPEHGSPVQGALYPREMVQPLAESGKWVQFTYYHEWLQTYEVGWALKKYFDRVPAPQDRVDDEIDETGS